MSNDTLLSNMQDEYDELKKRHQRARGADKQAIVQQMSHITKIMTQVLHNTSELEVRKYKAYYEVRVLKQYLKDNNIVSTDILDDLQVKAEAIAKEKIAETEKALERLYGEFKNICSNNTKSDPTAREAIKRT